MTISDLNLAQWYDISIMDIPGNKRVLILLCKDLSTATRLKLLLENNRYDLQIEINNKKEYLLRLIFIKTDLVVLFNSKKTGITYPPIIHLASSNVNHITTGIKGKNGTLFWDKDYLDLIRPALN